MLSALFPHIIVIIYHFGGKWLPVFCLVQSSLTFRVIRLLYHHCAFDWISRYNRKIDIQREFAGLFEATVSNALISSQYWCHTAGLKTSIWISNLERENLSILCLCLFVKNICKSVCWQLVFYLIKFVGNTRKTEAFSVVISNSFTN